MRLLMKSQKGFSLVEVMMAIGIIGIMSLILYPKVMQYLNKGRKSQVSQNLYQIRNSIVNFYLDTQVNLGYRNCSTTGPGVNRQFNKQDLLLTSFDTALKTPDGSLLTERSGIQDLDYHLYYNCFPGIEKRKGAYDNPSRGTYWSGPYLEKESILDSWENGIAVIVDRYTNEKPSLLVSAGENGVLDSFIAQDQLDIMVDDVGLKLRM